MKTINESNNIKREYEREKRVFFYISYEAVGATEVTNPYKVIGIPFI